MEYSAVFLTQAHIPNRAVSFPDVDQGLAHGVCIHLFDKYLKSS